MCGGGRNLYIRRAVLRWPPSAQAGPTSYLALRTKTRVPCRSHRELAPTRGGEAKPSAARRPPTSPPWHRGADCATATLFLLVLALGAGGAAGLGVIVIDLLLAGLRWFAFAIPRDAHLSDIDLGPARVLLMPVLGGLLVGLASALLRRWRQREVVDAIEANALFGGRMSVGDSLGSSF